MSSIQKRLIGLIAAFSLLLSIFSGIAVMASTGTVNSNQVNFRAKPSTSAKIIKKVSKGTKLTLISKTGNWYKAKVSGKIGYINSKYITKAAAVKSATVIVRVANLRKDASTSSKILAKLKSGNTVSVLSTKSSWYRIKTKAGKTGYCKKSFLKIKSTTTNRGSVDRPSKGDQAVAYAKTFLGIRYNYAHATPSEGFDCSGLVYYVYMHFGISLNRSSSGMSNNGTPVSTANLQPGDILFFNQRGSIDHTAMYIGGGKMIHSEPHVGVNIDVLMDNGYYEKCYVKAIRVS